MSQYKKLTTEQEKFLLRAVKTIWKEYENGTDMVYQWDLKREVRFIEKILTNRCYDLFYDADRLNSVGNLYKEIIK